MTLNRAGFTLLELLVATAAMALLTGAMLVVITALARQSVTPSAGSMRSAELQTLDLIRGDLINASAVAADAAGRRIDLIGLCGIHPEAMQRDGREVEVTYQIVETPAALVRAQRDSGHKVSDQRPLLLDIRSIRLEAHPKPPEVPKGQKPELPHGYRVLMERLDGSRIEKVLVIR